MKNQIAPLALGSLLVLVGLFALVDLAPIATAAKPPTTADFVGRWEGALAVGDHRLRIIFDVRSTSDGKLAATLDSPDQQATGIPVASVVAEGDLVRFDIRVLNATFEGSLSAELDAIAGEWRQSGQILPLTVRRGEG